jgi:hypothetical protein
MVPALPREVALKTDLLRSGVRLEAAFGSRHYHHHDEGGQRADVPARSHFQGSVQLPEGSHVFVTHNPASPYRLQMGGDANAPWRLAVTGDAGDEHLCEVIAAPTFSWTNRRTSHGTPMATVFTPSLGGACGPIAAFLLRHCEFTVNDEECAFCSWVRMGRSAEMRPNRDEMRETLEAIAAEQRGIGYLAFSGGSLFNRTKEADAFLAYMRAARATGLRHPVEAADETLAGMRWCCERGIYPKYAVWIVSGGARYGDRPCATLAYYERLLIGRQALFAEFDVPVPDCDCERCLTQSCEADLARLDAVRFASGVAAGLPWQTHHSAA